MRFTVVLSMMAWSQARLIVYVVGPVMVACLVYGLVASGSVSSLIAATLGLFITVGLLARSLAQLAAMGLAVGLLAIGASSYLPAAASSPTERIAAATGHDEELGARESTLGTRVTDVKVVWEAVRREPVFGVGLNSPETAEMLDGREVHQVFLRAWFEAGVLGLAGVVILFAGLFSRAIRTYRFDSSAAAPYGVGLIGALSALMVEATAEPVLYQRALWIVLPVGLAIGRISRQHALVGGSLRVEQVAPRPQPITASPGAG